ncbi:putative calcium-binding protein [Actinacidiphila reveromycinica]|uniref:Putative calcium-binding protein n=1 Tax=Actinacidiphila reveromycinica TaxID=659352 RepID=A0A7U3VP84_9ACTN|nr:EF-hand domain-containing protein [Streptomyces sp. SN-593]BBA98435.1 putative calcium-binding protein [Streptomyces sp. SN-593]
MGELLDQKYERLFSLLDVNGDGAIAEDDFVAMADRVRASFGDERSLAKGQRYSDAMADYWHALRATADADGNGRIDKDEFRRAVRHVSDNFDTLIGPLYSAGFHFADRDDDGLVDRGEFAAVVAAVGVPADHAGHTFDLLSGPSGTLTLEQLMTAAAQYYCDEDPANGASHQLFGPL